MEKKPGFGVEAVQLLGDIRDNLGIEGAEALRIVNCYDVEGLSDEHFAACVSSVFSQPAVDIAAYELNIPDGAFVFGKRLLPGQYDQRADSAAQCVQVITGEMPAVQYTKFHIVMGELTERDRAAVLKYCINPIDSCTVGLGMPKTLQMDLPEPGDIDDIPMIHSGADEIAGLHSRLGLAMSLADLAFIRDYFRDEEKREPTATEIAVIDTYWSDHCRHTTFHTEIENVSFDDGPYKELFEKSYKGYLDARRDVYGEGIGQRPVSLMDMAVMGMKALGKAGLLDDLDVSPEVNAASIVINVDVAGVSEEWLLMFKNETHNHPTEMEPFGGAATALGGCIRDVLSGRCYVYQAMRASGSADPRRPVSETLEGKLPQRVITTKAAQGYSSYGNQIGLAAGVINEIYHEGYMAKRMELGAVIGAVKKEHVVREEPKPGDVVILVGGRTGRDGIGGATGSSKEHGDDSLATCGAEVQKGNPVTERKLQRLFRNPDAARLILRCNDFGAGGVSVAIGELADSLEINLDAVRKKYEGLNGTELAISESQERMAVVVSPGDAEKFIAFAEEENLEAYEVAVITDTGRLVMKWRGAHIVDISREFLNTSGVRQKADVRVLSPEILSSKPVLGPLKEQWLKNLADLNVASQKGLVEMFDSTVGAGTVLAPLGGKYQLTPVQAMAAKIPVPGGMTDTVSFMSFGFDPYISEQSPYHGAVCAVVESVARLVAIGADYRGVRLTFQEYFERMRDAASWGKPFAALLGAFEAQMALGVPAIGGKDSMSGTFKDMHVPPTLVSFAVSTARAGDVISPEFKGAGNVIALLEAPVNKYGLPDFEGLRENFGTLNRLIRAGKVVSAYTIGFGGLAAAVSKMAFGNKIGLEIEYMGDMFASRPGSFVLELADAVSESALRVIGKTTGGAAFVVNGESICMESCITAWMQPLEQVFATGMPGAESRVKDVPLFRAKNVLVAKNKIARPRVFIPVFPGSNCEWDVAAKFESAGGVADIFVINNLSFGRLNDSVREMARRIEASQIIAIPGGFSAGDEPEGSGKFIAAIFNNAGIKEAVGGLVDRREGLIVGICNGFQALVQLGLVPYGAIQPSRDNSPTLASNSIGRHISNLVTTKIVSNKSPWFAGVNVGDIHRVAASHGEGRFVASDEEIARLFENGQVAACYVDFEGNATEGLPFNPNGSMYGIEAVTSPDGRILGKMCHSERIGGLYKNVPGDFEQYLFESGVRYFR